MIRVRLVFAIGVVAALALPATSAAKPAYTVKPKSLHLKIPLPASNGYSASIRTSGHRQVVLTFFQGSYQITYTTLGEVTRKGISADFGKLGHVSLRFRAKRPPEALPLPFLMRECKGRKSIEERGVFLGSVRFRGERGFTRIRSHRVKGQVQRFYRRVCKGPSWLRASASRASEPESSVVSAEAGSDGIKRTFGSVESGAIGLAVDVATLESKVDGVAIVKTAFTLDEAVFHLSPLGKSPVKSRMTPAWPFLGSATYLAEADRPATWMGSLSVRFPGSGQVPLAGPEFDADLCRSSSTNEFIRCQEESELVRLLTHDSGSHSHSSAPTTLNSLPLP
ncbi:MAG TPA: hypothetical protein VLK37_00115 [Solirubrobacterales bacterium]|nr:hypothetical protein [Solirubrobacterales bacterium]